MHELEDLLEPAGDGAVRCFSAAAVFQTHQPGFDAAHAVALYYIVGLDLTALLFGREDAGIYRRADRHRGTKLDDYRPRWRSLLLGV